MKFDELPYSRPGLAEAAVKIDALTEKAKAAQSKSALLALYKEESALHDEIQTAGTLASIRHTVDTRDEFYNAENDYFDEQSPVITDRELKFFRALLASPYKEALDEAYGALLCEKLALAVQSSDERLVTLQQEENALATVYEKLYASARIPFGGKELTLPQLGPYKQDRRRGVRHDAFLADAAFFEGNREELDGIYSRMVQNRTRQARQLGYASFTPLGNIRMERLGYTRAHIKACRDAVAKDIVPIALRLKKQQAERIGIAEMLFWDEPLAFRDGNPAPKGSPEEILEAGRRMYRELSPETAEFIDFMMDGGLFDVLSKPGKAPGGYCTYIPGCKAPFIFSNFNGTAGDVDVLTHEAGHAFQAFLAAKQNLVPQLRSPGLESCEIHSMSMEFLTARFHHLFFKEDTDKYTLSHAADSVFFLPYGCQVDEFQETVYNEPNLTPQQRNELWLDLEHKYRPWLNFGDLPFYSRGGGWQRQLHIYTSPFYYIDYVLAQAAALQFMLARENDEAGAWQRYLALTRKSGTDTYAGLLHGAGLLVPFDAGAMEEVGRQTLQWIGRLPLGK